MDWNRKDPLDISSHENASSEPLKIGGFLIGVVGETKAHLSENKRNVFSEFRVAVETVLKTSDEQMKQGSVVTIDRMGGFVTYSNGQKIGI